MNISELTLGPLPGDHAANSASDPLSGLTGEIARLANQHFTAPLAPPLSGPAVPLAPIAPPNFGSSAMPTGGGGASTASTLPPVPGFLHSPPLAASPPPKESDLRSMGALLSERVGISPVNLAQTNDGHAQVTPYFVQIAGLPGGAASGEPILRVPSSRDPMPTDRYDAHSGLATHDAHSSLGAAEHRSPLTEQRRHLGSSAGLFDARAVKRDFPILHQHVHGRELVWLDNAATTQKPRVVIERLARFYEHENSNIHRGAHTLAARATDAYEGAREKVRRFLNAPSVNDIVFTRGTTESINLVAQAWGRRNVQAGDEILITWLEHHANIVPWQQLAHEKGARLKVAPVNDRGEVILDEYERLLSPRTRIASITHVSNALGTINPVHEMVHMAHRRGARVLVDGAQAVSHMPVDVQSIDSDFYVFSGHKVFGPTGIGALYGKSDVLEEMPPWQGGGNMIADVTFEKTVYQKAPFRFEAGTGNIGDAVGLGAAIDYVTALGMHNIERYEHELLEYGTARLATVPGLRMLGSAREKAGVLSFLLDGRPTEEVGGLLDQEGIAVRSGHHCAQPILRRFGVEASVRASLAPYNTQDDIDALVSALLRLQENRGR